MEFIGTIKEIFTEKIHKSHSNRMMEKTVVILKMNNNQLVSIQFQGEKRNLVKGFTEQQEVVIEAFFNGQRTSKRFYDNIVGKKICKLN